MEIFGNSNGLFNVVVYNNNDPVLVSTFNSSLCAVRRPSNTRASLLTVRPTDAIPQFTQFAPGSGYIILAKENFILQPPLPSIHVLTLEIDTTLNPPPDDEFILPLEQNSVYDFTINWGDGTQETVVATNLSSYAHQYDQAGVYTIGISSNNNTVNGFSAFAIDEFIPSKDKIIGVNFPNPNAFTSIQRMFSESTNLAQVSATFFSNATNISRTWNGNVSLSSFPAVEFVQGIDFTLAWRNCLNLTTFAAITCNQGQFFQSTWSGCRALAVFPQIEFPNATVLNSAWEGCSSINVFPSLEFPQGIQFAGTWRWCNFKTFPALTFPKGQFFTFAWGLNTSLTDFPAISCPQATNFNNTWNGCTALTGFEFNSDTFSKMNSGIDCFLGVSLPSHTWSSILTSVCATNVNIGVTFNGGSSKRTANGTLAYDYLTNIRGWNISDGGPE